MALSQKSTNKRIIHQKILTDALVHSGFFSIFNNQPNCNLETRCLRNTNFSRAMKLVKFVFKPIVAPGLLTGQTDSRHFKHLAQNIYRFNPFWLKRADIERIHGHDERIAISNYEQQIEFFKLFLRDAAFSQSFP